MSGLLKKTTATILGASMLLVGCAGNVTQLNKSLSQMARPTPAEAEVEEYRLQPGDLISVVFYANPDMNQEVIVKPDGNISLFLIGNVYAQGLSLTELETKVEEEYSKRIKEPEIRLTMERFKGYKVYVGGEVVNPGTYPLIEELTLLQAIFLAGGFNQSAKPNRVLVYRRAGEERYQKMVVDASKMLKGEADFQDPKLKPFDTIYVSRSNIVMADLFVEQYINRLVPRPVVDVLTLLLLWERIKQLD